MKKNFSVEQIDRIIEMAWEDRTPFEAITFQFGIPFFGILLLKIKNFLEKIQD